jgi:hypothetical protein
MTANKGCNSRRRFAFVCRVNLGNSRRSFTFRRIQRRMAVDEGRSRELCDSNQQESRVMAFTNPQVKRRDDERSLVVRPSPLAA